MTMTIKHMLHIDNYFAHRGIQWFTLPEFELIRCKRCTLKRLFHENSIAHRGTMSDAPICKGRRICVQSNTVSKLGAYAFMFW